jgi:hypothetical protein
MSNSILFSFCVNAFSLTKTEAYSHFQRLPGFYSIKQPSGHPQEQPVLQIRPRHSSSLGVQRPCLHILKILAIKLSMPTFIFFPK